MAADNSGDIKPERGAGIRSVCDLNLTSAEHLNAESAIEDQLEPGDLILFRNTDNALSRLIASLDGYWCHSGIYVGDGVIVHAALAGVGEVGVGGLIEAFPEGMALARPAQSPELRARAAAWARDLADPGNNVKPARYSGRDLGLAWTLLSRAEKRGGLAVLPENDDEDDDAAAAGESSNNYESTCSGLAYRAYAEAAEALEIVTAPGIVNEDGRLRLLTEDEALAGALSSDVEEAVAAGPMGDTITTWKRKANLLLQAGRARASLVEDGSIPIHQGVSPADLWCSPSIAYRAFLKPEHAALAKEACADC